MIGFLVLTPGRSLMFHSPKGEQKLRGGRAELVENTTRIGPELAGERLWSAPKGRVMQVLKTASQGAILICSRTGLRDTVANGAFQKVVIDSQ